jgi:hypothetical protein
MKKALLTGLVLALASLTVGASPVSAQEGTAFDCFAAAVSYASTIGTCSTTVACWTVAEPATLGLSTWACIAASLACLASVYGDVNYGGRCMDWLNRQAQAACTADGGYAIWDSYSQTFLCMPQFEGSPPDWQNDLQQDLPGGGGSGGGGWWGGGWGITPGGSVRLWCCYQIGFTRVCNPC